MIVRHTCIADNSGHVSRDQTEVIVSITESHCPAVLMALTTLSGCLCKHYGHFGSFHVNGQLCMCTLRNRSPLGMLNDLGGLPLLCAYKKSSLVHIHSLT